ncbi:MAG TPA: HAMP domain-containing sensor histidine kinase [Jiangellaceae bacterium]|nr:HAMP domain-containing sensor histidine kinase [Jiangellaceae bacterium]
MRRSLALLVTATTSLVLVAFLIPLALLIRSATSEQAISAATRDAGALVSVVATADRDTAALAVEQSKGVTSHSFTVFYPDGTTVGDAVAASPAVELGLQGQSLTAEADGGVEIVVAVELIGGGTGAIRTFVTDAELTAGVLRSWLILGALGLGLVALGVAVADRLASSMIRPIVQAADVSHRLAGGQLDARADVQGPPEAQAVATGLNHLASRITTMLKQERESLADLSHRLRTPLMALRLEAEALPGDHAGRVNDGVDQLERAVSQVINDARARGMDTSPGAWCDAAAVVSERVAFWSVLAEDTGREVHTSLAAGPVLARCVATELAAALDALLGNVFAHTPDGTPFAVSLERSPGGVRLVVADGGPGFSVDDPIGRGRSGGASTGLGLDIARRVAESAGGHLTVGRSELGGAAVTLDMAAEPGEDPPAIR